ncbi:LPS translocon maturation chaperone LptM [Methylomonas paludis]|nr:lipoprotein [Methylomonas paludis]
MNNNNLVLIILALCLQACGQIGPLYLPDNPPPTEQPKK